MNQKRHYANVIIMAEQFIRAADNSVNGMCHKLEWFPLNGVLSEGVCRGDAMMVCHDRLADVLWRIIENHLQKKKHATLTGHIYTPITSNRCSETWMHDEDNVIIENVILECSLKFFFFFYVTQREHSI